MFEKITYEDLLRSMIGYAEEKAAKRGETLDTREGSLLWYGQAPAAVELQNLYIALDTILNEAFADTASREYLILRAKERGLVPYEATAAVLQLTITPTTLILEQNTRFSIGNMNYYVSEDLGNGNYAITCETVGEAGNDFIGTVVPIEYIQGLETCTITALLIPGENEEDTEVFRQRYFDSLHSQAFGGNKADYIEKINAIAGVGGVKIYRAWNKGIRPADFIPTNEVSEWISGLSDLSDGVKAWLDAVYQAAVNGLLTVGGTVKAVIIDSTFSVPSQILVDTVQTEVDPIQNAGEGVGLAPIGHVVKVAGVERETIDVSFVLTYQTGWTWKDVEGYVADSINGYFMELAKSWAEQEDTLVVRVSQIESRLLNISGILDIADTKINGAAANYPLMLDHIPTLGTLTAV